MLMKSYWMQSDGVQAQIELREVQRPVAGPGQILVHVRASGLNRGEFILGHGLHKSGVAKPIGMEAAGEVVSFGPGVTGFEPGDRVMGRAAGAFAEFVILTQSEAMKVPDALTWNQAAAIPLTSIVVFEMLVVQGGLRAGEWMLIPGVTSGVGVTALAMGKALGAHVIGTSGSQAKLDQIKSSGLDLGICTREANFHDEVMATTGGKGVDLVINVVGGSVFAECIRTLAFEGRLATVGYVDGVLHADMDIEALHAKRLKLYGVSNKLRSVEQRAQALPEFKKQILPLMAQGLCLPRIHEALPFERMLEAKAMMDSNQQLGKIVLEGLK